MIEDRSKVFFSWTNPDDGEALEEYPIEQQHWGGRIVGELNIDFVPLASHQKDAFDRNTTEWQAVFDVVHGIGPVLPQIRSRLNYNESNDSPLARLHSAFRRGNPPGMRWLVPGTAKGEGINGDPQHWAVKFWEGDPQYQTDEVWWQAVLQAEEARKKTKGSTVPEEQTGDDLFPGSDPTPSQRQGGSSEPSDGKSTGLTLQEEMDVILSKELSLPEMPGAPTLQITTSKLTAGNLESGLHIDFGAVGNRASMLYNPRHSLFISTLTEPVDCLVEELAYQLLQRSNANRTQWPMSRITQILRERYFPWSIRSFDSIREQAVSLLDDLIGHFEEELSRMAPLEQDVVTEQERLTVSRNVARTERGGEERVSEIVRDGLYPRYLGYDGLVKLIMKNPELALDNRFLSGSYSDVDEHNRGEIVDQVVVPLKDVVWAASFEATGAQ